MTPGHRQRVGGGRAKRWAEGASEDTKLSGNRLLVVRISARSPARKTRQTPNRTRDRYNPELLPSRPSSDCPVLPPRPRHRNPTPGSAVVPTCEQGRCPRGRWPTARRWPPCCSSRCPRSCFLSTAWDTRTTTWPPDIWTPSVPTTSPRRWCGTCCATSSRRPRAPSCSSLDRQPSSEHTLRRTAGTVFKIIFACAQTLFKFRDINWG